MRKYKLKKKMSTKQSEKYFSHQRCKKTSTNTSRLLDFDWQFTSHDYLILAFHWCISAEHCNDFSILIGRLHRMII